MTGVREKRGVLPQHSYSRFNGYGWTDACTAVGTTWQQYSVVLFEFRLLVMIMYFFHSVEPNTGGQFQQKQLVYMVRFSLPAPRMQRTSHCMYGVGYGVDISISAGGFEILSMCLFLTIMPVWTAIPTELGDCWNLRADDVLLLDFCESVLRRSRFLVENGYGVRSTCVVSPARDPAFLCISSGIWCSSMEKCIVYQSPSPRQSQKYGVVSTPYICCAWSGRRPIGPASTVLDPL